MNVFILGCGGFVGSNLVKYLLKYPEYTITGFDKEDSKIKEFKDQIKFIRGDIQKENGLVNKIISNSDIVIDLIAHANPINYIETPIDVVDLNFFQNLNIIKSCIKHKKRLIQFSSSEVYGMTGNHHSPVIFNEEKSNLILGPIKNQRWIYSCAKQLLERLIYAYGKSGSINYTIIRPFNFIGPKIDFLLKNEDKGCPRAPAQFISSLLYGRSLKLVDGGKNYRSYIYIDDASRAIKLIIDNHNGIFDNEIINIGAPNNETTVEDLANLMIEIYQDILKKEFQYGVEIISSRDFYGEGYEDCDRRIPDISKLEKIGWAPKYDLKKSLRLTLEYYINNEFL